MRLSTIAFVLAACLGACGPFSMRGARTVESVGTTDLSSEGILLRLMDRGLAELELGCGTVQLAWAQDTDGEQMILGGEVVPGTCEGAPAQDQLVLAALLAANTWALDGTDRVELDAWACAHRLPTPSNCQGADIVRLKRR